MITLHAIRSIGRQFATAFFLTITATSIQAAPPQVFEGKLQIQVEDHANQRSLTRYYLQQNNGQRFELRSVRGARGLSSGSIVRVRGTQTGNVLALDTSGSVNLKATSTAELAYSVGVQNVAVIMVNFSDDNVQPVTPSAMQNAVFTTTSNYLRENSGEQTWLAGSVLGWYTVPLSKTNCDPAQIATLADQAATNAGANLSVYTRKFYVFPKNACTWAGLADVGGANTRAWFNGKFDLDNFGHEFGHNLGLMHSHGLDCDLTPLGTSCTPLSYGDAADIMGNLEGHYNAFQKERLGWIPSLATVSGSGRYTLSPYENGTGTRALKIPRGLNASGQQTWYYLEYRQPVGFDAVLGYYGTLSKGVLVRTGTSGDADSTYLLDMTPNSDTSSGFVDLWDSALMAGRSYTDAGSNINVNVISNDAVGAIVDITVGSATTCTRNAPTVSLSAVPSAVAGSGVNVTVTITNRDSGACDASSFNLAGVVPSGWSSSFSASTLSISAGNSASGNFALTSASSAAAGNYGFDTNVSCSRGSACAGSASGVHTVLATALTETVATGKSTYKPGELVGLGAQLLGNGLPISGATVSFTITRPNGSTIAASAVTNSSGTASASYRMSKQKDPVGTYGLRAQSNWAGQTVSATTSFKVQ